MKNKFLLFAFILLLGIGGCKMGGLEISKDATKEIETDNDIIAEMINFEKNKYNDYSFEEISFVKKGFDYGYDFLTLQTKVNNNDIIFYVKRWVSDSGEKTIQDNLFGSIIRDKYEEMLKTKMSYFFEDYHIVTHLDSIDYPNSLNDSSTVDDLILTRSDISESTIISIYVKQNSNISDGFEKRIQSFVESIKDKDIDTLYNFLYVKDEYYDNIEKNGFVDKDNLLSKSDAIIEHIKIRSK